MISLIWLGTGQTRRDAFCSKILDRIKNRRKCKSSAQMDGEGYPEDFGNISMQIYTAEFVLWLLCGPTE